MVKKHNPQCVFLMETKRGSDRLDKLAWRLGYEKMSMVEAQCCAGGIAILRLDELGIDCLWKIEKLICCELKPPGRGITWKLLGVYGTPYRREKEAFWNTLDELVSLWSDPWLMVGDLNKLENLGEKFGGKITTKRRWFLNKFMQSVGAIDLGFMGKRFT